MCLASYSWILPVLAVAFVDLLAIWWLIKQLQSREPYASVIELGTRQKLRFFRFVLTDRRVPLVVKLIPSPVAAYLANPIDLIPDFLPVVGYLDDVRIVIDGLALIVKMVPFDWYRNRSAGRKPNPLRSENRLRKPPIRDDNSHFLTRGEC